VTDKSDGSRSRRPILAADRVIAEGLARVAPGIPALSEEGVGCGGPPFGGSFFLIDPLDGTKEFVAGAASSRSISRWSPMQPRCSASSVRPRLA
jgi:3'(2'), 5'-bisphosphate nucleotidase